MSNLDGNNYRYNDLTTIIQQVFQQNLEMWFVVSNLNTTITNNSTRNKSNRLWNLALDRYIGQNDNIGGAYVGVNISLVAKISAGIGWNHISPTSLFTIFATIAVQTTILSTYRGVFDHCFFKTFTLSFILAPHQGLLWGVW